MPNFEKKLLQLLEVSDGERAIHAFLKSNKNILCDTFRGGHNFRLCVPEFQFGNDYRADFLLLSADSCYWHAIFLELESPMARLYLKDGTESRALRVAHRQISDWRNWIYTNGSYFRQSLAKIFKKQNINSLVSNVGIHTKAETEILDPKTMIDFEYCIVIGRRNSLSQEDQQRRSMMHFGQGGNIEIATYDRIVATARAWDDCDQGAATRAKQI